mmetsp:Transcript_54467/g.159017  ORF Transcript_54467/g.159017 Transcript_54467/m.159017 type:complete len:279 (-) Transcript_54467:1013-1849(-)
MTVFATDCIRKEAQKRISTTNSSRSFSFMKLAYRALGSGSSSWPVVCSCCARKSHSSGNCEIMKARFVFTPSPRGGSVRSPTPARPRGLWFMASPSCPPDRRNSSDGMTHSLKDGMICVREGIEPGSKCSPVSASVSELNSVPLAPRSIHCREWKKKASRSAASAGKCERWMGCSFFSLCVCSSSPSRAMPAASHRFLASTGLMSHSSRRPSTMDFQTCCQPGPKVNSKRLASRPASWPLSPGWGSRWGRRSMGREVFLRSFRWRLCPMTLPKIAEKT